MRPGTAPKWLPLGVALGLLILAGCGQAGGTAPSAATASPAVGASGASAGAKTAAGSAPAQSSSAGAPADWQAQWDATLVKAKQEGRLAIVSAPGDVFRRVYDTFAQKYGIAVDVSFGNGQADLVPRLQTERSAGKFSWDVIVHSPTNIFAGLKPAGAADPLRPALLLPEVLDDSKWIGGFEANWADRDKTLAYSFVGYTDWAAWVNRNSAPESQINKFEQLWDPQWKGKIAWQDPSVPSSGTGKAATILWAKGEEKLRSLLTDQSPVITQDQRQLAEWIVRGQYPIVIALYQPQVELFAQQGIDVSAVRPLKDEDRAAAQVATGTGSLGLINRAPHPNAARIFINWLLSRDGQQIYVQQAGLNSRRSDVPPKSPELLVDPSRPSLGATEETYEWINKAQVIARDALKRG